MTGLFQQPRNAGTLFLGGTKISGADIRDQNVMATQAIANVVKSSFGPSGLDKMMVDDIGDVTGALEQTNRILMEKPSDVDALYNVGAIYANSNKMDLARDYWNRAVKSAPNSESGQKAAEGLKRLVQPPANPR